MIVEHVDQLGAGLKLKCTGTTPCKRCMPLAYSLARLRGLLFVRFRGVLDAVASYMEVLVGHMTEATLHAAEQDASVREAAIAVATNKLCAMFLARVDGTQGPVRGKLDPNTLAILVRESTSGVHLTMIQELHMALGLQTHPAVASGSLGPKPPPGGPVSGLWKTYVEAGSDDEENEEPAADPRGPLCIAPVLRSFPPGKPVQAGGSLPPWWGVWDQGSDGGSGGGGATASLTEEEVKSAVDMETQSLLECLESWRRGVVDAREGPSAPDDALVYGDALDIRARLWGVTEVTDLFDAAVQGGGDLVTRWCVLVATYLVPLHVLVPLGDLAREAGGAAGQGLDGYTSRECVRTYYGVRAYRRQVTLSACPHQGWFICALDVNKVLCAVLMRKMGTEPGLGRAAGLPMCRICATCVCNARDRSGCCQSCELVSKVSDSAHLLRKGGGIGTCAGAGAGTGGGEPSAPRRRATGATAGRR
jgi:hypothetical protein